LNASVSPSIAAGTSGIFALVTILLQRSAEEKRQIRELAVRVALENWKVAFETVKVEGGNIAPLDTYLLHAMRLVSVLDGSIKTPEQVSSGLADVLAVTSAAEDVAKRYSKNRNTDAA
jgi:hypothetical protein